MACALRRYEVTDSGDTYKKEHESDQQNWILVAKEKIAATKTGEPSRCPS